MNKENEEPEKENSPEPTRPIAYAPICTGCNVIRSDGMTMLGFAWYCPTCWQTIKNEYVMY